MSQYPWIVILNDGTLHCKGCGQSYTPAFPIPANLLVGLFDSFLEQHKGCQDQDSLCFSCIKSSSGAWHYRTPYRGGYVLTFEDAWNRVYQDFYTPPEFTPSEE